MYYIVIKIVFKERTLMLIYKLKESLGSGRLGVFVAILAKDNEFLNLWVWWEQREGAGFKTHFGRRNQQEILRLNPVFETGQLGEG